MSSGRSHATARTIATIAFIVYRPTIVAAEDDIPADLAEGEELQRHQGQIQHLVERGDWIPISVCEMHPAGVAHIPLLQWADQQASAEYFDQSQLDSGRRGFAFRRTIPMLLWLRCLSLTATVCRGLRSDGHGLL